MANVKYGDALGDYGQPQYFYTGQPVFGSFIKDKHTHKTVGVEYVDSQTGSLIDIYGSHLKFNGHVPTDGTVTEVDFRNTNGKLLMSIDVSGDDTQYDAHDLYMKAHKQKLGSVIAAALDHANTIAGSANNDYIISGNGADKLSGNAGNDQIFGMGGNDTLNGGTGDDVFWFGRKGGKDIIRDFDAESNRKDPHQDYLALQDAMTWRATDDKNAHHYGAAYATDVTFSDGTQAVLLMVHSTEITQADFFHL